MRTYLPDPLPFNADPFLENPKITLLLSGKVEVRVPYPDPSQVPVVAAVMPECGDSILRTPLDFKCEFYLGIMCRGIKSAH